ncbi:hypothetical protein COZ71_08910 [Candidatus Desantisbacteria bacterium CG_4_8_14_3_um_filter_40_12]|uniref:VCBS repeat-containing protein n=1 Tax=Candidatus Desantisbacteria bacterium CG_4_8_14_3_um_filter_40_12 TaxID=1974545 RepID=A0A2M7J986_9BACT|nr:MAG: hypothetical protein COZ71_08910 [Candidatus Desantisbacteria bacterium CG_4_8_14_3_um_filter_40_12]
MDNLCTADREMPVRRDVFRIPLPFAKLLKTVFTLSSGNFEPKRSVPFRSENDVLQVLHQSILIFLSLPEKLKPQVSYKTGSSPGSCKIADINNDGINEVITGDARSNSVTVHYP